MFSLIKKILIEITVIWILSRIRRHLFGLEVSCNRNRLDQVVDPGSSVSFYIVLFPITWTILGYFPVLPVGGQPVF